MSTSPVQDDLTPSPRRTVARWVILLTIYTVGLVVWAGYVGLIAVGVIKFFN